MTHSNRIWSIFRWAAGAVAAVGAMPNTAYACRIVVPLVLDDVSSADVVVIGRIDDYRIIRDEAARARLLAQPNLSAEMRRLYEDPEQSLLSDYARFDIQVDQVLVGRAPETISVRWDNSTFEESREMGLGPFLIALRRFSSAGPPPRGLSATILPNPAPDVFMILQAYCSGPFIFRSESEEAHTVQAILLTAQR